MSGETPLKEDSGHVALLFLLVLTAIQGLLWSILNPPFHAPDEPQHFLYATDMAATPSLRLSLTEEASAEMIQLATMNNFYEVFQKGYLPPLDANRQEAFQRSFRSMARVPGRRVRDSKLMPHPNFRQYHPPFYYALSAPLQRLLSGHPVTLRFQLQRWVTTGMSVATVAIVYWLTFALWNRRRDLALTVATLVAFHPLFAFQSGVISDQILEMLLFNALLLVLVGLLKKWWSSRALLCLGILTGLGALSRVSFLAALLPLACAWVLFKKKALRWIAAGGVAILLAAGWYIPVLKGGSDEVVWSYKTDEAVLPSTVATRPGPVAYLTYFKWRRWPQLLDDYWGGSMGFGTWPNTDPETPKTMRLILSLFFGIGLLASLLRIRGSDRVSWLFWSALLAYPLFFQALDYYFTRYLTGPEVPEPAVSGYFWFRGQYFLPALPAQMLLSVEGLRRMLSGGRLILPVFLLTVTSLYNLFFILVPRYYPGTFWEAANRAYSWSSVPPAVVCGISLFLLLGSCLWLARLFRLLTEYKEED